MPDTIPGEIVVHGIVGSPYMRIALLGLEEKRIPYRIAAMAMGASKAPAHLARHPWGRIPVIEDGDLVLFEAQAILRYLERRQPTPRLIPLDIKAEARMNQLMGVVDWYVFPQLNATITFNRVVAPHLGLPVNDEAVAAALPQARKCVAALAGLLQGRSPDHPDLADLMLGPHLSMFFRAPEGAEILREYPALLAWLSAFQSRPSMIATKTIFAD